MYHAFYGLDRKPFQISADPEFLWLGPKHKEGLAILVYGVSDNKGFLVMSGGVGTGKTTLIHALLKQLDDSVVVASVPDPGLELIEFYRFIAASYGMKGKYESKVDFLFAFEDFLKKMYDEGRIVLLIIDEAQRCSSAMLEEIRLLSNIEIPEQKLLNIFFVGQEEFYNLLADPRNRALKQRITINYHLKTLSLEETQMLIDYRLKVAGASRSIFDAKAVERIYFHSQGHPRRINIICDHALLTGFVDNRPTIGADIIDECAIELMLPGERQPPEVDMGIGHTDSSPVAETSNMTTNPTAPVIMGQAILNEPAAPSPPRFSRERIFTVVTALLVTLLAAIAYFGPQRLMAPFSRNELVAVAPPAEMANRTAKTAPDTKHGSLAKSEKSLPDSPESRSLTDSISDDPTRPSAVPSKPSPPTEIAKVANSLPPAIPARMSPSATTNDAYDDEMKEIRPVTNEVDLNSASALPHEQTPAAIDTPPSPPLQPTTSAEIQREASGVPQAIPTDMSPGESRYDSEAGDIATISATPIIEDPERIRASSEDRAPTEHTPPPAVGGNEPALVKADLVASTKQPSPSTDRDTLAIPPPSTLEQASPRAAPSLSKKADEPPTPTPETDSEISPPPALTFPQNAPSTETPVIDQPTDRPLTSESIAVAPEAPEKKEATDRLDTDLEPSQPETLPPEPSVDVETSPQTPFVALATPTAPSAPDGSLSPNTAQRLELFLQTYCQAYSTKDLDRFSALFTADAVERDRPFIDLIPVYRTNFENLDEISYHIDMQTFSESTDGREVRVKGVFKLAYRFGGSDWRSSSGLIEMTLVNLEDEYRVKTLDYRKKN